MCGSDVWVSGGEVRVCGVKVWVCGGEVWVCGGEVWEWSGQVLGMLLLIVGDIIWLNIGDVVVKLGMAWLSACWGCGG